MKILLVADYAAPYEGNFINSIKELNEKVCENNGDMIYSFPDYAKDIEWIKKLSKVRKVVFHSRDVLKNIKKMNILVKEYKIDIIYSHFCIGRTQLALKLVSKLNKIKLVQHYHNHYQMPKDIIKKFIFKWIFEGDLNIGCSESVAESIPYKNTISIPNAINFERLDKYEKIKLAEDNQKVILMFGFDYERKGVDIAIKAIQNIAEKYHLVLAISVAVGKEKIEQKIMNDFGQIPAFVKILEPRDDIATYYRAADIFLSAAREEGFCYSLLEAAYCDDIIISSKIQGPPLEIPNLYKFECENSNDLENVMIEICQNQFDEKQKVETREYVVDKFEIKKWVEDIFKNLEK